MKRMIQAFVVVTFVSVSGFLVSGQAVAGEQTVKLSVPEMNCFACPITVRKSLERVEGVLEASADLDTQTAFVVYDPALTDVAALIEAVDDVGYASTVMEEGS